MVTLDERQDSGGRSRSSQGRRRSAAFTAEVGRSYLKLRGAAKGGRWLLPALGSAPPLLADGGGGRPEGRGDLGMTRRSARQLVRVVRSLPWERLERPAFVSLTYPGDWRAWVPNGREADRHRRLFEQRWVRRWKEPIAGLWAKEFQSRGAPHLHYYLGLPAAVSEAEVEALRARSMLAKRLEGELGKARGRAARELQFRDTWPGGFVPWLRETWSEVVGTVGTTRKHFFRGFDVRMFFWSEDEEDVANRDRVAAYLAREAGKWTQKHPPEGYVGVGRYWNYKRGAIGFEPDVRVVQLDPAVFADVVRWAEERIRTEAEGTGRSVEWLDKRAPHDGLTVFGLGVWDQFVQALAAAEDAAFRRSGESGAGGDGGGVGGRSFTPAFDVATGELVFSRWSVEDGAGSVQ